MPARDCSSRTAPGPVYATSSRVRVNAIANYLGRGWATIIALVCLPLFLEPLGREAYGLIGTFAIIQAWALLLDFGMTPTLNREIVRTRSGARDWQSLFDLLRTVECVVIVIGAVLTLCIVLIARFLATEWLSPHELPGETVIRSISIMGVLAASRWIEQIYRAILQGTEDQVWLNVVQSITETFRWFGSLLMIYLVHRSIEAFFLTNLLVSLVSLWVLRSRVMKGLRQYGRERATFSVRELRSVRGFASGMFLSSVLAFLLTQIDKLVVGNFVSLADFGIYALAGVAAAGLMQLVQPMTIAVLPRFTALIEAHRREELATTFHKSSQWLTAIVLPVGLTIAAFPARSLLAWTGQADVATSGSMILSFLMLGSMFNALLNLPYMLQIAHGWTMLTNTINLAFLVIFLPILIWLTKSYAGVGAAAAIAALNLASLIAMSVPVLRRFLPNELPLWFGAAILAPTLVATVITFCIHLALPEAHSRFEAFVHLAGAALLIGSGVFLCLPWPRSRVHSWVVGRMKTLPS
jgi:O-antigen/teichoic acid export membrane protein